ncbi:MAG: Dabb family protein [Verrucomicrobiota bacterium]
MRFLSVIAALIMTASTALSAEGPVRHIVSFKFKPDATPADIQKIEEGFASLKSKISQVQSIEWGKDISPEGLAKGFTHMWVVTFANMQSLKTYIDHPDHVAFVNLLKPSLEDVFVFDFVPTP